MMNLLYLELICLMEEWNQHCQAVLIPCAMYLDVLSTSMRCCGLRLGKVV